MDDALKKAIIQQLINDSHISQNELAENLSVGRRTIQRKMNELKSAGIIEHIGTKNKGKWIVKTNDVPNNK